MSRLGECPRCGGDLYRDSDIYGAFDACIQCGCHVPAPADARPGRW